MAESTPCARAEGVAVACLAQRLRRDGRAPAAGPASPGCAKPAGSSGRAERPFRRAGRRYRAQRQAQWSPSGGRRGGMAAGRTRRSRPEAVRAHVDRGQVMRPVRRQAAREGGEDRSMAGLPGHSTRWLPGTGGVPRMAGPQLQRRLQRCSMPNSTPRRDRSRRSFITGAVGSGFAAVLPVTAQSSGYRTAIRRTRRGEVTSRSPAVSRCRPTAARRPQQRRRWCWSS